MLTAFCCCAQKLEHVDTINVENKIFYIYSNNEGVVQIRSTHDTIHLNIQVSEIKYSDFNGDGYTDILFELALGKSNIHNEIFLFSKATGKFRQLMHAESFPDPERVEANLYTSFSAGGCAALNQIERLFYIKDYNIIEIASMEIIQCGYEENGSFIYSGIDDKRKLLAKFPIDSDVSLYSYYKLNKKKFKRKL
jgi:hypothetical protein